MRCSALASAIVRPRATLERVDVSASSLSLSVQRQINTLLRELCKHEPMQSGELEQLSVWTKRWRSRFWRADVSAGSLAGWEDAGLSGVAPPTVAVYADR